MKMIPVFRDTLQQYLGIGDGRFGFLLSVLSGAGLFTVLIGGAMVDRWGPRRVLRISLFGVACAFTVIAASGRSWIVLAIGMALYGFSMRPLVVAVSGYLIRLFPNNRRRVLSLNFAGTSVGSLFFPSVAEGLLQLSRKVYRVTFGIVFHMPYVLFTLLVLGATFLYRCRVRFGTPEGDGRERWSFRDLLLPPQLLPIILLMVLHGTCDSTIHLWMARFLDSDAFAGDPVIGPGYVLSGYAVSYILSRLLLGLMPENFGKRLFMILPGILGGSVLIAGILSKNYLLTAGGYVLGGFLWSAEFPTMLSVLADEESERFGAAMALHQVISALAIFVSLNAMGTVVEKIGEAQMWKAMLIPACGFPMIGILAAVYLLTVGRNVARD
ncbi:MAG: MFS transporter [Candidatus Brocadiia bacterium]